MVKKYVWFQQPLGSSSGELKRARNQTFKTQQKLMFIQKQRTVVPRLLQNQTIRESNQVGGSIKKQACSIFCSSITLGRTAKKDPDDVSFITECVNRQHFWQVEERPYWPIYTALLEHQITLITFGSKRFKLLGKLKFETNSKHNMYNYFNSCMHEFSSILHVFDTQFDC